MKSETAKHTINTYFFFCFACALATISSSRPCLAARLDMSGLKREPFDSCIS